MKVRFPNVMGWLVGVFAGEGFDERPVFGGREIGHWMTRPLDDQSVWLWQW